MRLKLDKEPVNKFRNERDTVTGAVEIFLHDKGIDYDYI